MYSTETWRSSVVNYINGTEHAQLTEHSPQSTQPLWIKPTLRPHQLTLLEAARQLEQNSSVDSLSLEKPTLLVKYGVLSDRVGAGKSLVALSMVRDPPPKHTDIKISTGNQHEDSLLIRLQQMPDPVPFKKEWANLKEDALRNALQIKKDIYSARQPDMFYTKTSLLVVPHNICQQWETYIKEQTTLKSYIVKRTKDCDYDREGFYGDIFMSDLVVVSCTMMRKFMAAIHWRFLPFENIVWTRVFIDEADSIHLVARHKDISARFTWFITGSWLNMLFPDGFYNYTHLPAEMQTLIGSSNIPGVYSRMNYVASTLNTTRNPEFAKLILRNSEAWVNVSLQQPTVTHSTIMCQTPSNFNILRDFIKPEAMQALHAGDTAGALQAMGIKPSTKESMIEQVTASLRGDLLQEEKILALKRELTYSTEAAKRHAIETGEKKIQELRAKLVDLEGRVANVVHTTCPICYDVPQNTTLTPCCRNAFCLACLCECITKNPSCPLCRAKITSASKLIVLGEGAQSPGESTGAVDELPTKGAALINLIAKSRPEQRFLVFSAHEASFKGVKDILKGKGVKCEMLMGSAARIETLRKQFREGKLRVLCMNARHIGAGINLESATDVVLYHRMNTELEKQVIGRAIRFERAEELTVTHLVHDDETAFTGAQASDVIVHV